MVLPIQSDRSDGNVNVFHVKGGGTKQHAVLRGVVPRGRETMVASDVVRMYPDASKA